MSHLLLIKHSEPVVDLGVPSARWVLSDRGRRRGGLLAAYLAERGVDALYSSNEVKAVETAEMIADATGLAVGVVPALREHGRGNSPVVGAEKWRSLVIESIQRQQDHIYGTEPVSVARDRFAQAVGRLMGGCEDNDWTVAVVAHGTVISAFVGDLLGIDPVPVWDSLGLPGLVEIEWPRPTALLTRRNFE